MIEKENKLIINSDKGNLLNELIRSIKDCESFYFSVAFINFSGLQLLLEPIKEAEQKVLMVRLLHPHILILRIQRL